MNEIGFYTNQAKMQFKCNHRKGLNADSSGLPHCVRNDRMLDSSVPTHNDTQELESLNATTLALYALE